MKKSTLMFLIGGIVAFFGYRYFVKGKSSAAVTTPGEEKKGSMILPQDQTQPLSSSEKLPVSNNINLVAYNGPNVSYGAGMLTPGDKVEGWVNYDTSFTVSKILSKPDYPANVITIEQKYLV